MSGQRRFDAGPGRLAVPYLPDHHHVGVSTQDAPEARREGQADLGVDLYLVDAAHAVLNGVLYGDDVLLWSVELFQGGVERCRLPATRRACHEYRPVGSSEDHLV